MDTIATVDTNLELEALDEPQMASLRSVLTTVAELTGVSNVVVNAVDRLTQRPLVQIGVVVQETPWEDGLCRVAVGTGTLVHTDDAALDPRFAGSVFTAGTEPAVRLYAAAPLIGIGGEVFGTLCVFDSNPGHLNDRQLAVLGALADHVMRIIELGATRRCLEAEVVAAAASERRQRQLLEASPDAFCQVDDTGTVVAWSPSATVLLGYLPGDAIGNSAVDLLIPAADRKRVEATMREILSTRRIESPRRRLTVVRGDGEERNFELTLWLETAPDLLINMFARDITDQAATTQRIEDAETRWRLAFDAAPIGMALQRVSGTGVIYERVNEALCAMTGYGAVELQELGSVKITHVDDLAEDSEALDQLITGRRRVFERMKRYIHADGHVIHVQVSSVLTHDSDGDLIVSQVQDITTLRETLLSLEEKAALLDLTQEAIFVRRLDGTITFWNKGAQALYGIPAARALGRQTHHLLETEFPMEFEVIRKQLAAEGHWEGLLKQTDIWGNRKTVMSRWAYRVEPGGEDVILEINSDVTEASDARVRQERAEALFELAFVHASVGVGILGTTPSGQGRWLQANEALRQLSGSSHDLYDQSVSAMLDPTDAPDVVRQLSDLFRGRREEWRGEWRVPTPGGRRYLAAQCIAVPQHGDDQERIVLVQLRDITRQRAHENWLRGQAVKDALTHLPNRLAISETLEREIAALADHGNPLAVLFLDLNRFKTVNDTLGHAAGDAVLTAFAERLRAAVPGTATVGRLGGDEFVVLAPGHDNDGAAQLARRIRETTTVTAGAGAKAIDVTTSIGWSVTTDPSTVSQAVLAAADASMYADKRSSRPHGSLAAA